MTDVLLRADKLEKAFGAGGQRTQALKGVSMEVRSGEVLSFLGPNGAGKTTTIKILTGLIEPDAGRVVIGGQDPLAEPSALQAIGTVLEGNRNLYWRLTAQENIEYFGALKGLPRRDARARGRELLARLGLEHKRDDAVQALSRGMQQKVAIAVALVHRPRLLLFDEPTLGLDVEAAVEVKAIVREVVKDGCGVILTTHQLEVAEELSDRVSIIKEGAVVLEERTSDLLRRFTGDSYAVTVEHAPTAAQEQALERAGAVVAGQQVLYRGPAGGLYAVFAVLAPTPILRVERDNANLTDVFLRILKESGDDRAVSSGV